MLASDAIVIARRGYCLSLIEVTYGAVFNSSTDPVILAILKLEAETLLRLYLS
jgi:hypothetical protein